MRPGKPGPEVPLDHRAARADPRPRRSRPIHVVGGGCKNALLCQFTADACGIPVHAGPIEATAAGNILLQAMGRRRIGSLADARAIVAASFPVDIYEPRDVDAWRRG